MDDDDARVKPYTAPSGSSGDAKEEQQLEKTERKAARLHNEANKAKARATHGAAIERSGAA